MTVQWWIQECTFKVTLLQDVNLSNVFGCGIDQQTFGPIDLISAKHPTVLCELSCRLSNILQLLELFTLPPSYFYNVSMLF